MSRRTRSSIAPTAPAAPPPLPTEPPDAERLRAYFMHIRVEKRLSVATLQTYTLHLDKLLAHARLAGLPLCAVRQSDIRRWAAQMHSRGRSPRGIMLTLSVWRSFYTWLARNGSIAHNPVQDVHPPKIGQPLPKALGVDESMQLASYTHEADSPIVQARDRCITELLYGCGLRVSELVGLDIVASRAAQGWVDLDACDAHVLGKGAKRRSVPIGGQAMLALQAWLNARPLWAKTDPALFIGVHGQRLSRQHIGLRLKRRSLLAGLSTPVHPHMLRHSFASHVLQSSGDLRAVQELLGHASISSTQVYTRLDFQHLAKVYDMAHPRAHALPNNEPPPLSPPAER